MSDSLLAIYRISMPTVIMGSVLRGAIDQIEDPAKQVTRNTLAALLANLTTAAFTAVLTLYLIRVLHPQGFGIFSLAISIGAIATLATGAGLAEAASRFVAERRTELKVAAAVAVDSFKYRIILSLVSSIALFVVAGPIADAYKIPGFDWPLRAVSIAIFGQSIFSHVRSLMTGLGRSTLTVSAVFFESLMETGASIALVALGAGATGAVFGRAAGYLFGMFFALLLLVRALGGWQSVRDRVEKHISTKELLGYSLALFIINAAYTLFDQIDALVIGGILGATSVGLYQAPARLVILISYPGMALASGVAPRLAKQRDKAPDVGLYIRSLRLILIYQAFVIAPVIVWSGPIMDLIAGSGYAKSADVLLALAPFIYLSSVAPYVTLTINYAGFARARIPIVIASVLINLGLDLWLVNEIGIIGAAISTDIAFVIFVGAHLWIARRSFGAPILPQVGLILRTFVATAAMAACLFAFGTDKLGFTDWILGALSGTVAYFAALFIMRVISYGDVVEVRSRLDRLVRRRG